MKAGLTFGGVEMLCLARRVEDRKGLVAECPCGWTMRGTDARGLMRAAVEHIHIVDTEGNHE